MWVSLVSIVVAACSTHGPTTTAATAVTSASPAANARRLPTIAELLATRATLDTTKPARLLGDEASVALALGEPIADEIDGPIAELARCLRADARRDYPAIVRHCATSGGLCEGASCRRAPAGDATEATSGASTTMSDALCGLRRDQRSRGVERPAVNVPRSP
jgi:hypothetical protein